VTSINPTVDSNSRTVSVEAKFANQDLALKPGMFATARILLKGSSMGIFLPRASILTDPSTNSSQVFFVRDGKARVAVVQLGAVDGDMIQILSGIAADFVVATNHLQDLFDGEPVDSATTPAQTGSQKTLPRLTEPRTLVSGLSGPLRHGRGSLGRRIDRA
jgi:membrane fusion protein (multidrug efflux system)